MQALKNAEEFVGVLRSKPAPLSRTKMRRYSAEFAGADLDQRGFTVAREFHGVREEISENDFHQAGVAVGVYERIDPPVDFAIVRFCWQLSDGLADHILKIDSYLC